MITQKQDPSIHRRQKAICVFLVLDKGTDGANFTVHQQIYEAFERGEFITAFQSNTPRFSDERMSP